ncbi:hypothetical protein FMEXI_13484 [Fusarium mexicanum]|uniref:Uncharacterized protein n=1 Tax=Fusarium mexicanum TaxID=751941 RepID=A0A8H5I597_9HYPO|nr:hypothetical protein FMEXI_13484 [Fusarium mexicanum]
MFGPREDAPAILVALHGASSELSIGLANEVISVTRELVEDFWYETEEWCLLGQRFTPYSRRDLFSQPGDSGSCIFDNRGRIASAAEEQEMQDNCAYTLLNTPIQAVVWRDVFSSWEPQDDDLEVYGIPADGTTTAYWVAHYLDPDIAKYHLLSPGDEKGNMTRSP